MTSPSTTEGLTVPEVLNAAADLELTAAQVENARHALGLNRVNKHSYRNYFVTGEGSVDYEPWLALAAVGLAARRTKPQGLAGDDVFYCTRRLAEAVQRPGESLDPSDFPKVLDEMVSDYLAALRQAATQSTGATS